MDTSTCPICGAGELQVTSKRKELDFAGRKISYQAEHSQCSVCEAHIVTPLQLKGNKRAIVAAKSAAMGLPPKEALRAWRKRWGLTQKDAGDLLGVGDAAFSKYENAALMPSAPTSRLLDAVMISDDVVYRLAKKHHVPIEPARHQVLRSSLTWVAEQLNEPVFTIIRDDLFSCAPDLLFGSATIEGIEELGINHSGVSINARKQVSTISNEWVPSSISFAGNPSFVGYGEKHVAYG